MSNLILVTPSSVLKKHMTLLIWLRTISANVVFIIQITWNNMTKMRPLLDIFNSRIINVKYRPLCVNYSFCYWLSLPIAPGQLFHAFSWIRPTRCSSQGAATFAKLGVPGVRDEEGYVFIIWNSVLWCIVMGIFAETFCKMPQLWRHFAGHVDRKCANPFPPSCRDSTISSGEKMLKIYTKMCAISGSLDASWSQKLGPVDARLLVPNCQQLGALRTLFMLEVRQVHSIIATSRYTLPVSHNVVKCMCAYAWIPGGMGTHPRELERRLHCTLSWM